MPLIETLTLLASLGTALQGIRATRPDERPAARDETTAGLLLSYEYVRTSRDWALSEDASLSGRMQTLVIASGLVVAGAGVLATDGGGAGSPLFIAALIVFGVMVLAVALVMTARPALIATQDVIARQTALGEVEFLREMLADAGRFEQDNRKLIATKTAVLGLLYLGFAALVVLLGVWAVEG